jgi:hypothetical protein
VYDTRHEEIVHREYTTEEFNTRWLRTLNFKGLFECNNEIVLFVENFVNNRHALNRIRFDALTGAKKEDTVLMNEGFSGETNDYFVVQEHHTQNYAIFSRRDVLHITTGNMALLKFSASHQLLNTVPVHISYKKPDLMKLLCFGITDADDIYFNIAITGKPLNLRHDQFHHQVAFGFLPRDSSTFSTRTLDLPDVQNPLIIEKNAQTGNLESYSFNERFPFIAGQAYDALSRKLSLIVVDPVLTLGTDKINPNYVRRSCKYVLFSISPGDMSMKAYIINYNHLNELVKSATNSRRYFQGIAAQLLNKRGRLTLISENFNEENLGELGITLFNTQNEPEWDTIMPRVKYTGGLTTPEDILSANTTSNDLPEQQYNAVKCYATDSLMFIFCNENELTNPGAPINPNKQPDYRPSDGMCYVMNDDGQYVRLLPFGEMARDETRAYLMESTTYNASRHTFACLVEQKKGDNTCYRVAWCYLTNFITR